LRRSRWRDRRDRRHQRSRRSLRDRRHSRRRLQDRRRFRRAGDAQAQHQTRSADRRPAADHAGAAKRTISAPRVSMLDRRTLLGRAGTGALAAWTSQVASEVAFATAPVAGRQGPGVFRSKLGSFELTALYDGTWFRKIDDKFVRNASAAQVNKALTDAFLKPG